jgi:hypothetical protein
MNDPLAIETRGLTRARFALALRPSEIQAALATASGPALLPEEVDSALLWSAKTASRTGGREEGFLMLPAKGRIAADGR